MSDFVRNLNRIKTKRNSDWLTPSQQRAFTATEKVLQAPSTVNLFGREGVGKTFLAWILAYKLGYVYLAHPSRLEQIDNLETSGVILDNCQSDRQAHRDLLKTVRFQQIHQAVFITRQMINDYTHYVELNLTIIDQEQVQKNLADIGLVITSIEQPNLWHLINPHL